MSYLFGFSGRINRAKIWLFILVTLAWEIVIGLVAVVGLSWTKFVTEVHAVDHGSSHLGMVVPWPDKVGGAGWVAVGVIALLIVLYVVALFAVYTKRLHDRNKSAWWLIPFLVIPFGVQMLGCVAAPNLLGMGEYFGPLGMGWNAADLIATILGLWAFIELFFFRGTAGENRYGSDPLAR
jgi:uncharacterized membrane protein YhaH (DUF805 family)